MTMVLGWSVALRCIALHCVALNLPYGTKSAITRSRLSFVAWYNSPPSSRATSAFDSAATHPGALAMLCFVLSRVAVIARSDCFDFVNGLRQSRGAWLCCFVLTIRVLRSAVVKTPSGPSRAISVESASSKLVVLLRGFYRVMGEPLRGFVLNGISDPGLASSALAITKQARAGRNLREFTARWRTAVEPTSRLEPTSRPQSKWPLDDERTTELCNDDDNR